MKKLYYVANREIGNYANVVTYFSTKKKLDAYIKAERRKGNIIKYYFDDLNEEYENYWDIVWVN